MVFAVGQTLESGPGLAGLDEVHQSHALALGDQQRCDGPESTKHGVQLGLHNVVGQILYQHGGVGTPGTGSRSRICFAARWLVCVGAF